MSTAVVTIAHGRHEHLRLQQRSLARGGPARPVGAGGHGRPRAGWLAQPTPACAPGSSSWPPIPAACRSPGPATAGRQRALELGADVLVFLDVDCLAGPGLTAAYADAVREQPGTVWSGPVTYLPPPGPGGYDLARLAELDAPHPARPAPAPGERAHDADPDLFWSLSFALSAAAWSRAGGFHEGYVGYGGEDTDFARVLLAGGLRLGWLGAARAFHQWHPDRDPAPAAPGRHPAQRGGLRLALGLLADGRLAGRVRARRPGAPYPRRGLDRAD